ncbi:MAG: excinuclease ABC subunit UvrC [Vicinamibacterales bacterium]
MPIWNLKDQIARLPEQPGVYLYANAEGETIYVGKARSLRDRVRSYVGAQGASPKTDALLEEIERLEVIVTDSVVEALALENHLIKQRMPRFNILLRDDKNYPYLRLTTAEAFPRLQVVRRIERDGQVYAGPFLPASLGRRTMSLVHRVCGIRSCNETITGQRGRPCLEYDIKRCLAPCVTALCSETDYARAVADARLLLEGRTDELIVELTGRMRDAAGEEHYEQAAQLRDSVKTLVTLRDRQQKISSLREGDRDVWGVKVGPLGAVAQVFLVRTGKVVDRLELISEQAGADEPDVIEAALQQTYQERDAPGEVVVPTELADAAWLEEWLSDRSDRRVRLVTARRGEKRALVDLAKRNAAIGYDTHFNTGNLANVDGLEQLRQVLGLGVLPRRIECFDISTIQGSETVASMVVSQDGRLKRSEYRKFRVLAAGARASGAVAPNDFAAMREVVSRRYRRVVAEGGPMADLLVIDGGPGQLSAAYAALTDAGVPDLLAVGLAKKEELIFTRDRAEPIALPVDSPGLLLLQRLRDEAHRFAVTFHRRARAMRDLRSELDAVAGIGPRRRQQLLKQFGSVAGVRRATREELSAAIGARSADAVLAHFAISKG